MVYYEGSKFQIYKTRIPVKGVEYDRVALCSSCGYFHQGDSYHRETCENCQAKLTSKINRILTMETAIARRRERITCDEEERLKYGYDLATYFRYDDNNKATATVIDNQNTATIWRINRGLKRSQEKGFKLDRTNGMFGYTVISLRYDENWREKLKFLR